MIKDVNENYEKIGNILFDKKILNFLNYNDISSFIKNIKSLKIVGKEDNSYFSVLSCTNDNGEIMNIVFNSDFNIFNVYNKNISYYYDENEFISKSEKIENLKKEKESLINEIKDIENEVLDYNDDDDIIMKFNDKILKYFDDVMIHDDISIDKKNIEYFLNLNILNEK